MVSIASRIKEGLEKRNMKQADLVSKTGIGKSSISTYISGEYEPKQRNIYKIAEALNVDISWLMGYDVPMERDALSHLVQQDKQVITELKNSIPSAHSKISQSKKSVEINVLGRVAAGIPIEAVEEIIDTEEITETMATTGDFFGLQIHGDSMEPKMSEGDIVIVRQQNDADSGDTVIAMINGSDATCKRLKKYAGGIMLLSTNQKYEPMVFSDAEIITKPVRIIGKVVELRCKFN